MRHSTATLAVIAVLIASTSVSVLARGRGSHSGRSFSGTHSGTHSGVGHFGPPRFFGPRVGLFVGAPLYAPYFYPPPAPYYPLPPPVYMEQTPYMQQSPGMQQAPGQGVWYFCRESNAYYPYVEQCPGGWQQVAPQPRG